MAQRAVAAAMTSTMGALQHPHDVAMVSRFRLEVLAALDPHEQPRSEAARAALQFPPARWLALVRMLEAPEVPAPERDVLLQRARRFEEAWVERARDEGADLAGMAFRWQ